MELMQNTHYMPLQGALLISNPRSDTMAYARANAKRRHQNWKNKSAATKKRAATRHDLRTAYRKTGGKNWHLDAGLYGAYLDELAALKAQPIVVYKGLGTARANSLALLNAGRRRSKRRPMTDRNIKRIRAAGSIPRRGVRVTKRRLDSIDFLSGQRRDIGEFQSYWHPKVGQFKSKSKHTTNKRGHRVIDSAQRGRQRSNVSDKRRSGIGAARVKAVSQKRDSMGRFLGSGGKFKGISGGRKASGSSRSKSKSYSSGDFKSMTVAELKRSLSMLGIAIPKNARKAQLMKLAAAAGNPLQYGGRPRKGTKAYYRAKHRLARQNYGSLALDNYGAFALENMGLPPFVAGVTGSLAQYGKLSLVGLAGALGHAYIGSQVSERAGDIPVIGGYIEKALGLQVPEMIPVIGGMELDNTITGIAVGAGLAGISAFLGHKFNQPAIAKYGITLATGVAMAGPIIDFACPSSAGAEGELNGLALEEDYGDLALLNEGTFGDGMAYQLGAIGTDEDDMYGQASLADAYYSGADFDLGEGQALVNGKGYFQRRFGAPTQRIHKFGGSSGASHLASKPGHRWGWLIKMIGWANVQKLAAMPPKQRVTVIKQLRENALATFQQIEAEAPVLPTPELAPAGAEGVSGIHGAYGATVFGGGAL